MNEDEKNILRNKYAKIYNVNANDIDNSLLPFYLAQENTEKKIGEAIAKIQDSVKPVIHQYPQNLRPMTAYNLKWGWSWWVMGLALIGGITWLSISYLNKSNENDQQILQLMEYDDLKKQYFISAENYQVTKKGVIIKLPTNDTNR